jgi:hypothetical protein
MQRLERLALRLSICPAALVLARRRAAKVRGAAIHQTAASAFIQSKPALRALIEE